VRRRPSQEPGSTISFGWRPQLRRHLRRGQPVLEVASCQSAVAAGRRSKSGGSPRRQENSSSDGRPRPERGRPVGLDGLRPSELRRTRTALTVIQMADDQGRVGVLRQVGGTPTYTALKAVATSRSSAKSRRARDPCPRRSAMARDPVNQSRSRDPKGHQGGWKNALTGTQAVAEAPSTTANER